MVGSGLNATCQMLLQYSTRAIAIPSAGSVCRHTNVSNSAMAAVSDKPSKAHMSSLRRQAHTFRQHSDCVSLQLDTAGHEAVWHWLEESGTGKGGACTKTTKAGFRPRSGQGRMQPVEKKSQVTQAR